VLTNRAIGLVSSLIVSIAVGCGGDSSTPTTTPTAPSPTQPTITGVAVSPSGVGIESTTAFTFTVQGVSDPDGESTYLWTSTDGQIVSSTTGTVEDFIYERSGVFDMRVTVTNSQGGSVSASKTVTITNLTGVWDLDCVTPSTFYSRVPSRFVVTLEQSNNHAPTFTGDSGTHLYGSISGGGYTRSFTFPGKAYSDDLNPSRYAPRTFVFGVESYDNPWAWGAEDMLFTLALDETGTSATGTTFVCGTVIASRR
jgi:hypothetical protein